MLVLLAQCATSPGNSGGHHGMKGRHQHGLSDVVMINMPIRVHARQA